MKKITLLFSLVFLFLHVNGQRVTIDKVPAAVKSSFKTKYPGVVKVGWQMANANEYKANFTMKKSALTAYFSPEGTWRQTETMMKIPEIPQNIRRSIPKQFPGSKIRNAYKISKKEGAPTYKILIQQGSKLMTVIYSIAGEMLKKGTEN